MITASGRYLGAVKDDPDPRDHRYRLPAQLMRGVAPPQQADLRAHLPAPFDQGQEGSCGACSGSALMCYLTAAQGSYSRQQIYYDVRVLERTPIASDAGVQTRDVLKTLQKKGTYPETLWDYTPQNFALTPPRSDGDTVHLTSYSRLVSDIEYLTCLTNGYPFILGFTCYESIDSQQLAKTGVMMMPGPQEKIIGGHDVTVVGYDLNFKVSDIFKASGVDPATAPDEYLLIRNSWGINWGIQGHFWMPLAYATNPSLGGDAWTGRL